MHSPTHSFGESSAQPQHALLGLRRMRRQPVNGGPCCCAAFCLRAFLSLPLPGGLGNGINHGEQENPQFKRGKIKLFFLFPYIRHKIFATKSRTQPDAACETRKF